MQSIRLRGAAELLEALLLLRIRPATALRQMDGYPTQRYQQRQSDDYLATIDGERVHIDQSIEILGAGSATGKNQ